MARELAAMFYAAGWTDAQKLLESIAVCIAESNAYEHRTNLNYDPNDPTKLLSTDRGIWMLNDKAFPDVPDSVAFNAVAATKVARKIYVGRGYSFRAWAAYNNKQYLGERAMGYSFDGVANFLRLKNGYKIP